MKFQSCLEPLKRGELSWIRWQNSIMQYLLHRLMAGFTNPARQDGKQKEKNMNAGKQFEKDFKASVLDDQFYLRLNDAGGWSKSVDLRFTPSQLCDCLLFTGERLYLLELKSHQERVFPASCLKQTDTCRLDTVGTLGSPLCATSVTTRDLYHRCVYVQQELTVRKSLSLETCRELGTLIPQRKLRIHWRL